MTQLNIETTETIKAIAPYFKAAIKYGLSKDDAVFYAFWAHQEIMLRVAHDEVYLNALSRISYAQIREEPVDPAWRQVVLDRLNAHQRFVCLGEKI